MDEPYAAKVRPSFWKRRVPAWTIAGLVCGLAVIGGILWYGQANGTVSLFRHAPIPFPNLEFGASPSLANADHFNTVKNQLVAEGATFIEADLTAMVLRVYKEGQVAHTVPILTKGREGSWWETPAGVYRIEWKSKNHFSSFGRVYSPWSMAFQGNFFIHGWPYYPDGTPVSSQFSGGCIRLSDEDAKAVYDLVEVGTPVIVFEQDSEDDGFDYVKKRPDVTAEAFLAADLRSNSVLAEKDSKKNVPTSSLAKFVTALVAAEHLNLDKAVRIAPSMIVETSRPRLVPGQSVQAFQLLYPLLMESSNEAAEAFAQNVGLVRFVDLMNRKAAAIGMTATQFADPAGRTPESVSTAEDLFVLLKYIHNNRSFVLKISTGELRESAYGAPIYPDLVNGNDFRVTDADFLGGKMGEASASGTAAIAVYDLTIRGEKRPIAFVLLDPRDVRADMQEMVAHVLREY